MWDRFCFVKRPARTHDSLKGAKRKSKAYPATSVCLPCHPCVLDLPPLAVRPATPGRQTCHPWALVLPPLAARPAISSVESGAGLDRRRRAWRGLSPSVRFLVQLRTDGEETPPPGNPRGRGRFSQVCLTYALSLPDLPLNPA